MAFVGPVANEWAIYRADSREYQLVQSGGLDEAVVSSCPCFLYMPFLPVTRYE